MNTRTTLAAASLLALCAHASADCGVIDNVAATSYERANEALSKGWAEAAHSAAYFFWYVHDLADCQLTRTMAVHMTKAGLVRGTVPTGPAATPSSRILVSVPSSANFAQASGSFVKGMYAPETLVVNGATYKLQAEPTSSAISKTAIEEFLRDSNRTSIGGYAVDKDVLQQWKSVPVSPAPLVNNNLPRKAGG